MSYLHPLRLHFAGRFRADVPTSNNIIESMGPGKTPDRGPNPGGDGSWRLKDCQVTAAYGDDGGRLATDSDPILGCIMTDGSGPDGCVIDAPRFSAKIVDFDPQNVGVPRIYGLEIRIHDGTNDFIQGEIEAVPARDHFGFRAPSAPTGDGQLGCAFQSVLVVKKWGTGSKWVQRLQELSADGKSLSIKFNLDLFGLSGGGHGRIVGTIGPWLKEEPKQFIRGRHLLFENNFNHGVAVIDTEERRSIFLDLGNSLQFSHETGSPLDFGPVSLRCAVTGGQSIELGQIAYKAPDWYATTAGIVDLALPAHIGEAESNDITSNPLEIWFRQTDSTETRALVEMSDGIDVRTDDIVLWMSPGDSAKVKLYATVFGRALGGARLTSQFEQDQHKAIGTLATGSPEKALSSSEPVTNDQGIATAILVARQHGNPRREFRIDGQIYSIRYRVRGTPHDILSEPLFNVVNVKIWDSFTPDTPVTWEKNVLPIFARYKEIYPVTNHIDLASEESVRAHALKIIAFMACNPLLPVHMPVSRDLSPAKRKAILNWLGANVASKDKGLAQAKFLQANWLFSVQPEIEALAPQIDIAPAVPINRRMRWSR